MDLNADWIQIYGKNIPDLQKKAKPYIEDGWIPYSRDRVRNMDSDEGYWQFRLNLYKPVNRR